MRVCPLPPIALCLGLQAIVMLGVGCTSPPIMREVPRRTDSRPKAAAVANPESIATSPTDAGDGSSYRPGPTDSETWGLGRCIQRALVANRSLLDASSLVEGAAWSLVSAESAFELRIGPRAIISDDGEGGREVGVELGLSQRLHTGTEIDLVPTVTRADDFYSAGYFATFKQPLLRGSHRETIDASVDRARFGVRNAEWSRHLIRVDTMLATIEAVYRVVQERETLRLSSESATRSQAHLEAARARERAGLSSSIDVFRATQQQNRTADALDSARQALDDALDSLRLLLALPLDADVEVTAPLELASLNLTEDDAIQLALHNRVELLRAQENVSERARLTRVATHDLAPELDLVFTLGQFGQGLDLGDAAELQSPTLGVSLITSTDVRRTSERATLAQAKLSAESAQRNLALQRDFIVQEVRRSMRNVTRGHRAIDVQRSQLEQARGKLGVARTKFELGLAGNFDVIEAEEDLRSAETGIIRAVVRTIASQHQLRAALGTLIEAPGRVDDDLRRGDSG